MRNVEDIYPLTPTQAGMLFQTLRDDDPELYFEQVRAQLDGTFDPGRLESAFVTVALRHPALRSAIVWDGLPQPVQAVRETVDLTLEELRVGSLEDVEALAAERRRTCFDFAHAPLQRIAVVTTDAGENVLLWEFNHIICDGWSAALVLDEVLSTYNGTELVADPPPFRDFLAWHGKQDPAAALDFWEGLLDGFSAPTPFALPTAESAEDFRAGEHFERLGEGVVASLQDFARANRLTLNTLVQGAWAVVQSRYSGSDDVVFGVTTSGRPADLAEVERMVGMFLNTLPMRLNAAPQQAIQPYLQAIQTQQLEAGEHAFTSLADLHRIVGVEAGGDLFDTVLIFENFPKPPVDADAELQLRDKTVFEQTNYPLTLMVGVEDRHLQLVAHFDRNRFTVPQVEAFMGQFKAVLTSLVVAETVADLAFFPEAQCAAFEGWQGTNLALERGRTVIGMLLAQAHATPDAMALLHGNERVSFGELVDRGRDVAKVLKGHGVGPEVAVGIGIPRSVNMVVAIVGTLLAGGAYLPLDPKYPAARLQLMAEASGAPVVLTDTITASLLPAFDTATVLDIAHLREPAEAAQANESPTSPDDTLLLTFTSGSTGVPKGVRVHHAGVLNRCNWQWNEYPLAEGEVFAHKTTLSFVDHLWEIWGALLQGHAVMLLDDAIVTDAEELITTLASQPVRRMSLVPSLLDVLLDHEPKLAARLPTLTDWSVSGEALSVATAERFHRTMPNARLINLYGMSEASQDATFAEVPVGLGEAPIGRPIANMRVDLVDDHGRRVPVGVPGHLHVSGIGLSPGYWRQPALTAERFFDGPHGRTYRSGDVARWSEEGVLYYLGRSDHQVKVRGVRIELGEIETALASHPAVDRAVATGWPSSSGMRLVGYVIPMRSDAPPSSSELADHVAGLLPAVMVPSVFEILDRFPLLPNGKVNRAALPSPAAGPSSSHQAARPLTDAEKRMLAVWRDVMDNPRLGIEDDFFAAGGHSMMAMQLASRIKNDLGLTAPLAQLLKTPTPRRLLAVLDGTTSDGSGEEELRFIVPILEHDPSLRNFYVFHGAGGDILNLRDLANRLRGRLNVIGIQAGGLDGRTPMHQSADAMVSSYLEEILTFDPGGPYLLAGFSVGGRIAVEVAERLRQSAESVDCVVLFDTYHPTLTPRTITKLEHLQKAVRQRNYAIEKWTERRERQRLNRVVQSDSPESTSLEALKWEVTQNNISLWKDETRATYSGRTVLFSTTEVEDIWDGIPDDRGWSRSLSDLTVIRVDGDHMNLIEEPYAARIAAEILALSDRSVDRA